MSIFSDIGNIVKKLFTNARPELEKFLEEYKALGIKTITELSSIHDGASLHEWEQKAFDSLKTEISKNVVDVKDNWIKLLTNFSYEDFKGVREKADQEIAATRAAQAAKEKADQIAGMQNHLAHMEQRLKDHQDGKKLLTEDQVNNLMHSIEQQKKDLAVLEG